MKTVTEDPTPLIIVVILIALPILVFGYFHLKNSNFFDKFKRKKKDDRNN
jgi:hypothetical protein